jgi:O-antigen/teichoic acid export membrane protein
VFGPEGQGRYALAVFLPTLIVLFSNLGVPSANVYFVGRGDVSVRSALAVSAKLWLILSLGGLAVGAVVIRLLADRLFPGVGEDLLWIALGAFPLALMHAPACCRDCRTSTVTTWRFSRSRWSLWC